MSINEQNFREKLVEYIDNELSPVERKEVEQYMLIHAEAWDEYQVLKRIRLKPDMSVAFPNKARLFRHEEVAASVPAVFALPGIETKAEEVPVEDRKTGIIYRIRWYAASASAIAALLAVALIFNKPSGPDATVEDLAMNKIEKLDKGGTAKPATLASESASHDVPVTKHGTETSSDNMAKQEIPATKKVRRQNTIETDASQKLANTAKIEKQEQLQSQQQESIAMQPVLAKMDVSINNIEHTSLPVMPSRIRVKHLNIPAPAQTAIQQDEEDSKSLLEKMYAFAKRSIKIEKETIDGEKYYALSLETDKVKIEKSFRANF